MKELIDSFQDYRSVERALAKNTILAYRADLNLYLDFIEQRGYRGGSRTGLEERP